MTQNFYIWKLKYLVHIIDMIQKGSRICNIRGHGFVTEGVMDLLQKGIIDLLQKLSWVCYRRGHGFVTEGVTGLLQKGSWICYRRGHGFVTEGVMGLLQKGSWVCYRRGHGFVTEGVMPLWNVNLESSLTMVKHGQNMVVYVVRSDFDSGRL